MLYDKPGSAFHTFSKLVFGFALFFTALFIRAFVFMKLWNCFAVPAFNVNQITVLLAFGLTLIWSYFTWSIAQNPKYNSIEKDEDGKLLLFPSLVKTFGMQVGVSGSAWVLGYIVHYWM